MPCRKHVSRGEGAKIALVPSVFLRGIALRQPTQPSFRRDGRYCLSGVGIGLSFISQNHLQRMSGCLAWVECYNRYYVVNNDTLVNRWLRKSMGHSFMLFVVLNDGLGDKSGGLAYYFVVWLTSSSVVGITVLAPQFSLAVNVFRMNWFWFIFATITREKPRSISTSKIECTIFLSPEIIPSPMLERL